MADNLLPAQARARASHGRGGAGNIGPTTNSAAASKANLVTPTIKGTVYTTGRGGSGNMKRNDPQHPEVARKSQDVEAPPGLLAKAGGRRGSAGHTGRGGVANILRPGIDDLFARDEHAVVEEGRQYDRQRSSENSGQQGDWWRDEMANGKAAASARV